MVQPLWRKERRLETKNGCRSLDYLEFFLSAYKIFGLRKNHEQSNNTKTINKALNAIYKNKQKLTNQNLNDIRNTKVNSKISNARAIKYFTKGNY